MAEEVKHTPGPWRIDSDKIEHGCCWDTAIVATVPKGQGNYGEDWSRIAECNDDNARLIAEAPDLLATLMELGHSDEWYKDVSEAESIIYRVRLMARLAVAKIDTPATLEPLEILKRPLK